MSVLNKSENVVASRECASSVKFTKVNHHPLQHIQHRTQPYVRCKSTEACPTCAARVLK